MMTQTIILIATAMAWVAMIRTAVSRPDDPMVYLIRLMIGVLAILLLGHYLGDPI